MSRLGLDSPMSSTSMSLSRNQPATRTMSARPSAAAVTWRAPELAVTNLSLEPGGGRLDANVKLNVATRGLAFTNSSCFNINAVSAWLPEKARAWLAEDVAQCGFCQPGMIMTACGLLHDHPEPTNEVIDTVMSDSVCRCGAYPRMRKAIRRAAEEIRMKKT